MEKSRQRLIHGRDNFPYKIELHVHLDGAIRLSTLFDISRRRNISLHAKDEEEYRNSFCVYHAKSLYKVLASFGNFMPVVAGDRDAIRRLAYEFCEDCSKHNIRYVETRFSPHLLANNEQKPEYALEQGDITPREVVRIVTDALKQGSKDFNIRAKAILCCMRHRPGKIRHFYTDIALIPQSTTYSVVANSVDPDERAPERALSSGSTMFVIKTIQRISIRSSQFQRVAYLQSIKGYAELIWRSHEFLFDRLNVKLLKTSGR